MSRGKLHISHSYHSFYPREETKSIQKCSEQPNGNASLYQTLLFVISLSSLLPSFHLAFFVNSLFCGAMRLTTCIQTERKEKKRAFDDRIDSLFLTKTFVYFCPIHTQLLLLLLSQLFFVKGQYKLFWDGANRKILNLLISPRKITFSDLKLNS